MKIKVLGPGCSNCRRLEANVKAALASINRTEPVEKVTDIASIMQYGIMTTPGLVIDEKVVVAGRVPSSSEIVELLQRTVTA